MARSPVASPEFLRLLGNIDVVHKNGVDLAIGGRETVRWYDLSDYDLSGQPSDEPVLIPSDHEQPPALSLLVRFQPQLAGVYDLEWIASEGATVRAGEELAHAFRVTDGHVFVQNAPFDLVIVDELVKRNRKVVEGDALARVSVPSLAVDLAPIEQFVRQLQIEIAQAANAMVKGFMGYVGQSGQVAKRVFPVERVLHPERGFAELLDEIVAALSPSELQEGDIVVISEKVISIAQGRLFPLDLLYSNDSKTVGMVERGELLEKVREFVPDVDATDLLMADSLLDWPSGPMATAGVADPNGTCFYIATRLQVDLGKRLDIVISDTDTGLDVRQTIIGCVTIGATPIGSTAGLAIYECMRVANAAEFSRGSTRGVPIVICRPHPRRGDREGMGEYRGYQGRLDAQRERLIGFA